MKVILKKIFKIINRKRIKIEVKKQGGLKINSKEYKYKDKFDK